MKVNEPIRVRPSDGGRLITAVAKNAAGLQNYTVKRNWRRDLLDEKRSEGHDYFLPYPDDDKPSQYFPGTPSPILLLGHAERANGTSRNIAGDRRNLLQFDPATKAWAAIATGKSASGRRWESVRVGEVTVFNNGVDLPLAFRPGDTAATPIYSMRDAGIASVGTIAESNGVLICGDVTQIVEDDLDTVRSQLEYYGSIDAQYTERYQFRMAWSNVDDAEDWNHVVPGTIGLNKSQVVLKYRSRAFKVGQSILIQEAGATGGNHIATITAVSVDPVKTTLIFDPAAITSVTEKNVTLANAATNISAFDDLIDDSSAIVRIGDLQGFIVVYKASSSIFVGQYTGETAAPFNMGRVYHEGDERERARGLSAIAYRNSLIDTGEMHIYAGQNSFYYFDLTTRRPQVFGPFEDVRNLFFDHVSPEDDDAVSAGMNILTGEAWLIVPNATTDKVLRFDTKRRTVSTSDEAITAMGTFISPANGDTMFVMGTAEGVVLQYGLSPTALAHWDNRRAIYWRRSAPAYNETRYFYDSVMEPGFSNSGYHGVHLRRYAIDLSDKSPDSWCIVEFLTRRLQGQPETIAARKTFHNPATYSAINCHIKAGFIQDRIICRADDDLILSGRMLDLDTMPDHAFGRMDLPGRDLTLGREDIRLGDEIGMGQTKTIP